MRAILFILILAVVLLLIAIWTGFLQIHQTRTAVAPQVSASRTPVKGGQTPTFDIETGSVSLGTKRTNAVVPVVKVNPPNQQTNQAANGAK